MMEMTLNQNVKDGLPCQKCQSNSPSAIRAAVETVLHNGTSVDTWEADCLRTHGRRLTGQYAHWCKEWDFMPIDETCPEFDACICKIKNIPPLTK